MALIPLSRYYRRTRAPRLTQEIPGRPPRRCQRILCLSGLDKQNLAQ